MDNINDQFQALGSISLMSIVGQVVYLLTKQVPKGVLEVKGSSAHNLKNPSSPQSGPQELRIIQYVLHLPLTVSSSVTVPKPTS